VKNFTQFQLVHYYYSSFNPTLFSGNASTAVMVPGMTYPSLSSSPAAAGNAAASAVLAAGTAGAAAAVAVAPTNIAPHVLPNSSRVFCKPLAYGITSTFKDPNANMNTIVANAFSARNAEYLLCHSTYFLLLFFLF
jgi:hypothetical protein